MLLKILISKAELTNHISPVPTWPLNLSCILVTSADTRSRPKSVTWWTERRAQYATNTHTYTSVQSVVQLCDEMNKRYCLSEMVKQQNLHPD